MIFERAPYVNVLNVIFLFWGVRLTGKTVKSKGVGVMAYFALDCISRSGSKWLQ